MHRTKPLFAAATLGLFACSDPTPADDRPESNRSRPVAEIPDPGGSTPYRRELTMAIRGETVIIAHGGKLEAIDQASGARRTLAELSGPSIFGRSIVADDRFVYATTRTPSGGASPTHAEHETGDLVAVPLAGGPMETLFAVENVDCRLVLDRGQLLTCDDSGLQTSGRLITVDVATRQVKTARFGRGRFCLSVMPVGDELLALMLDDVLRPTTASLVALPSGAADDESIAADEEVFVLTGLAASTRTAALDGEVVVERFARDPEAGDQTTLLAVARSGAVRPIRTLAANEDAWAIAGGRMVVGRRPDGKNTFRRVCEGGRLTSIDLATTAESVLTTGVCSTAFGLTADAARTAFVEDDIDDVLRVKVLAL